MPQPVELIMQRDFRGGVNFRADQFQLGDNESPDMLNMDVDPRGGVRMRPGVSAHDTTLPFTPSRVGQFHTSTTSFLVVGDGTALQRKSTGSWASIASGTAPWAFAAMKDSLYMVNGTEASREWTGSGGGANLGSAWSDDFAAPTSGNMPVARCIVAHHSHMWVADTLESATRHPSRVRWSHPNLPEAWRTLDWIDVDPGVNNESIVNLVPFSDHLLVFKPNSVYAIFGFGWDSFTLQNVSREVGSVAAGAAVATPLGVYFFDWPNGVMLWDGRKLSWAFERLAPAIDRNILASRRSEIRMGWADNRLWVSVPWGATDYRLLVMDPSLGKDGSWVVYDIPVGQIIEYEASSGTVFLGAHRDDASLLRLASGDAPYDDFGAGQVHIDSYYRTRWFDAGLDAMRKRFRRPWTTFWGDGEGVLHIDTYNDFDGAQRRKTWTEAVLQQTANQQWDDPTPLLWDSGVKWGQEGTHHTIERGSSLGNAHSVQMNYRGPETNVAWGIDAITVPYQPRRVR